MSILRRPPGAPPIIMGVLNVTPDSFSDGGSWTDIRNAVYHADAMASAGASIIDVGAESTRPGSTPVSAKTELERLVPLLKELVPLLNVPVSVDTSKPEVAEKCIDMGVKMINDVNGLRAEGMAELIASTGVEAVIMHMNGVPSEMPDGMNVGFEDEIKHYLDRRIETALDAGISRHKIALDPGIGFGKDAVQNEWILRNSSYFSDRYPILSGSSRKRFLSTMFPNLDRDEASAIAARIASDSGASAVRVHNVGLVKTKLSERLRQL